jgi:hypothetical protein
MASADVVRGNDPDRDQPEGTGSGSGDVAPHEAVPRSPGEDEGPGSRFDELARAAKRDAGLAEESDDTGDAEPGTRPARARLR